MRALLDRRTDGFSQGERMKTALARALVHDPPNIVLDEPTNGLDVLATRALREALRHLASPAGGGKCIVLSSHVMQEVERLCDRVVVIAAGRTVAEGTRRRAVARTGRADFEEAFVELAFGPAGRGAMSRSWRRGPGRRRLTVFRKEIVDALRDRRTLATVLLSSVLIGPLVLVLLSSLVATLEKRAELREVVVVGLASRADAGATSSSARPTASSRRRPTTRRSCATAVGDPVLVVAARLRGRAGARRARRRSTIVSDSSQPRRRRRRRRASQRLLRGLQPRARGAARWRCAACGAAAAVDARRGARPGRSAARAARLTAMLPFFVLMAVLYGALTPRSTPPPASASAARSSRC